MLFPRPSCCGSMHPGQHPALKFGSPGCKSSCFGSGFECMGLLGLPRTGPKKIQFFLVFFWFFLWFFPAIIYTKIYYLPISIYLMYAEGPVIFFWGVGTGCSRWGMYFPRLLCQFFFLCCGMAPGAGGGQGKRVSCVYYI